MDIHTQVFLVVAVVIALAFEFVNGFHDTANAVATVIYTRSLSPRLAVLWSGFWNFLGVQLGGIAVAFAIVSLLPIELVIGSAPVESRAMVLALLTSAILWNLLTWMRGLPASSSHALIGSIVGVGLANAHMSGRPALDGVNWSKVAEVGISLFFSPMLGFVAAALLLLALRRFLPSPALHSAPVGDAPPPPMVRASLLLTCTGVSFAHGSNDGQKGIGLVMLILIGVLPAQFALNPAADSQTLARATAATRTIEDVVAATAHVSRGAFSPLSGAIVGAANPALASALPSTEQPSGELEARDLGAIHANSDNLRRLLTGRDSATAIPEADRAHVRELTLRLCAAVTAIEHRPRASISRAQLGRLKEAELDLRALVHHAPRWVIIAVALALGIGTTVGWKRVVVTVGEKIGKSHLTYAQGAVAELVAMSAIGVAGIIGMPVSTTHVLASGIAGTMAAQKSGLQTKTIQSIALAWILTLPVCMMMSAALFPLFTAALR